MAFWRPVAEPVVIFFMDMKETEKLFEEYREYLKSEAIRLVSYIKLYRRMNERKSDRLHEMNVAPSFFQVTLDALFSAIILWVDKLLGARSERVFNNFLAFVENNRDIFAISELQKRKQYPNGHWMLNREPITYDTIDKHRKQIAELDSLPHFKLRRDKFHAHFDKAYFFDRSKLGNEAPLKWSDLEEVTKVMNDILNHYSAAYDGNVYHLEPFNIYDIDQLLDIVHSYNVKRKR
ncbi:hypothetical protein D4S03_07055 [bacterium]|nr:MAG: hypothetical protein D4S03_07055 [bacterium]